MNRLFESYDPNDTPKVVNTVPEPVYAQPVSEKKSGGKFWIFASVCIVCATVGFAADRFTTKPTVQTVEATPVRQEVPLTLPPVMTAGPIVSGPVPCEVTTRGDMKPVEQKKETFDETFRKFERDSSKYKELDIPKAPKEEIKPVIKVEETKPVLDEQRIREETIRQIKEKRKQTKVNDDQSAVGPVKENKPRIIIARENWRQNTGESCVWNSFDMIAMHAGFPDPGLSERTRGSQGMTSRSGLSDGAHALRDRGIPTYRVEGRKGVEDVVNNRGLPCAVSYVVAVRNDGHVDQHCTVIVGVEDNGDVWTADNCDPPGKYKREPAGLFWSRFNGYGIVVGKKGEKPAPETEWSVPGYPKVGEILKTNQIPEFQVGQVNSKYGTGQCTGRSVMMGYSMPTTTVTYTTVPMMGAGSCSGGGMAMGYSYMPMMGGCNGGGMQMAYSMPMQSMPVMQTSPNVSWSYEQPVTYTPSMTYSMPMGVAYQQPMMVAMPPQYGAPLMDGRYATPTGLPPGPGILGVPGAPFPFDGPVRRAMRGAAGYDYGLSPARGGT